MEVTIIFCILQLWVVNVAGSVNRDELNSIFNRNNTDDSCVENEDCNGGLFLYCNERKCRCIPGYHLLDNICTKGNNESSALCFADDECKYLPYTLCYQYKCICKPGFIRTKIGCIPDLGRNNTKFITMATQPIGKYHGYCSKHRDCIFEYAICNQHVCTCALMFLHINGACESIRNDDYLFPSCTDASCSREKMKCDVPSNKCKCITGYTYSFGYCRPNGYLNTLCLPYGKCRGHSFFCDRLTFTCACKHGYKTNNGYVCVPNSFK